MTQQDYHQDSALMSFAKTIETGQLDEQLSKTVLVIDGFSRFLLKKITYYLFLTTSVKRL